MRRGKIGDNGGPPMAVEPFALPLRAAVSYSGISRTSIYRLLASGALQGIKHGKSLLIEFKSLKAYCQQLPRGPAPAPPEVVAKRRARAGGADQVGG